MKLKITVETHRDRGGQWVAQVLIAGRVVYEDTGPVSESQAVANAVDGFACVLADLLKEPA